MTLLGWIFMILSWSLLIGFTIFCYIKAFSKPPQHSMDK